MYDESCIPYIGSNIRLQLGKNSQDDGNFSVSLYK